MDGRLRFQWRDDVLYQRLILPPHQELAVRQVRDSVDPRHPAYNPKAHRAKLVARRSPRVGGRVRLPPSFG